MNKQLFTLLILGCLMTSGKVMAAPAGTNSPNLNAGVQMNRMNAYLERERVAKEIHEEREKSSAKVEQKGDTKPSENKITFQLDRLEVDESKVLEADEIRNITAKYEGREVQLQEVYNAVEEINKLYEKKGYMTCRAFLKPQKIENATVRISLFESKTGKSVVTGNKYTKDSYILDRLPLKSGEILSLDKLNEDILRFNGTNDIQLRVVLKAGEQEGTTDYYIEAKEPKNSSWTLFSDNTGSKTTGEYRYGLFYNVKSLTGVRDSLMLGSVFSEGTWAFSSMYSRPVGHSGTKLNLSYSDNSIEQVKNTEFSKIEGKASSYGIGLVQPWIVKDNYRSEWSLDYSHQTSKSDLDLYALKFNVVNDTMDDLSLGLAMTSYGRDYIIYQKHSVVLGHSTSEPELYLPSSKSYSLYKFFGMYQKLYKKGNQLSLRLDGQLSGTQNLLSARQYYIGGMYSVRGYQESFMGADHGVTISAEYSVPLTKDNKVSGFTFLDFGYVFGEGAESNNVDNMLYSTGLGLRAAIGKNINGVVSLGVPLRRSFASKVDKADSVRLNFMLTAQF